MVCKLSVLEHCKDQNQLDKERLAARLETTKPGSAEPSFAVYIWVS